MPTTSSTDSIWGDIPTWVGVFGALIAFGVGLYQYHKAQLWQRSQFVAQQMSAFFADPCIKSALLLLDYSRIRLTSAGTRAKEGEEGRVFDDALLIHSLRLHTAFQNEEERFNQSEMLARESFDALFTWLESFDHFLVAGLVTSKDLSPYLRYWLKIMADPKSGWKPPEYYAAVSRFITGYGYHGVRHLIGQICEIDLPDAATPRNAPAELYEVSTS